ncbi:hypothetical protein K32_00490 [Kaistia sp. 32K]|uniref:nuclear transport factor 2 family protein n=1 Tax=Kaistia sp. 32K TaxID=2795690 RepID=UPI001916B9DF|nr:nuclear transport factor 2 family protein [Kaistia sp. 32K]BCP51432.1 hypothetical protein K32_00490 [Kaistia sp. 32K]
MNAMTDRLPEPIAAYYAAEKADDFEALALCFAVDATVRDEGAVRTGRAAIAAWKAENKARYRYETEVIDIREQDGAYLVSTRVSGSFPNSPVLLTQRFELADGEIRSLEIA